MTASVPRKIVPEVIQTSNMDCGPASLKALFEGFGVAISYGRLREACQTDVDGTSISTMEEVAGRLGLACEEVMLPADHLLVAEANALPAIVVIRLPSGFTHFVVVWSVNGPLVQVMDPASGRRWMTRRQFLAELYEHVILVPAEDWREWAGGEEFQGALRRRLADLGVPDAAAAADEALAEPGWEALAALDAATRMVAAVVEGGGLRRGAEAGSCIRRFAASPEAIPELYWFVRAGPAGEEGAPQLKMRGAVLVRALERREADEANLSEELRAALREAPPRPGRLLLDHLLADGLLLPGALAASLALSAIVVLTESLLLRGLLDLGPYLGLASQRLGAVLALVGLVGFSLLLELPAMRGVMALSRSLEGRLRQAFLAKIPRLPDRYFKSRLNSDMAERSHSVFLLRRIPELGRTFLRACFQLSFTTLGLIWLDPRGAPFALLVAGLAVALPLIFHPLLSEKDLKVRSQLGALSKFYLDALRGLAPIASHGAARTVRREQEQLLVEWGRAGLELQRSALVIEGTLAIAGALMAVALVALHTASHEGTGSVLLLVYWALSLPALGQEVAVASRQYPSLRSVVLRLMEPLQAPEAEQGDAATAADLAAEGGVAIAIRDLGVVAGGHTILRGVNLDIPAGSHVAIVGPSGAGKSSLVGLLLGWHRPAAGEIAVDGQPLTAGRTAALRRWIAWVDPEVHLWNRSLLENLRYGAHSASAPVGRALAEADLMSVLDLLQDGLQTPLGEGGGLVSGGQGQRVRLGRALARGRARLAILDEPFRGLDRGKRRQLLQAAREWWRDATLLCITHDVGETAGFPRVLVVEGGQVVEDGDPQELLAREGSRYRALVEAEESVREGLWRGAAWRRLWLSGGKAEER